MSTATAAIADRRVRLGWVDTVRGVAILLMLLDHVLVQVDPYSPLRVGSPIAITRLSLPLFMLAAAAVWRPGSNLRYRRLWGAALVELVLVALLGMPQPGIVVVFLFVLTLVDLLAKLDVFAPYWIGVAGLVQALYVPIGWDGYEPGLVAAWWSLGYLATAQRAGRPLTGSWAPLAAVGRWPVAWYLGHLAALLVLVEVGVL